MNGRLIDTLLVEKYIIEIQRQYPKTEFTDFMKSKLYKSIIKCKEKLSATGADTVYITYNLFID